VSVNEHTVGNSYAEILTNLQIHAGNLKNLYTGNAKDERRECFVTSRSIQGDDYKLINEVRMPEQNL
jgi:hypothetical protein